MGTKTTSMVASLVGAAATAIPTKAASMGMGYTPGTCRISMLWNWYVIDSCFITRSWHNKTQAQFAGSCIGVILICILLEFIRRAQREYDRALVRRWEQRKSCAPPLTNDESAASEDGMIPGTLSLGKNLVTPLTFRPTFIEQAIRALFYVVQFWAAYLIMLLAMYYNGYIIICILIGVFLGHFAFGYDNIVIGGKQETGTSCC